MASRDFEWNRGSLEKKVVDLYARVTFGAAGAPTLDGPKSKGIKSITRTGAGAYTIVLSDPYARLLGVQKTNVNATAPAAPAMYVVSETVATVASPAINVVMNSAGTATDPASGEEIRFSVTLKNSSLP